MIEGYCVKCRTKREFSEDAKESKMKNGRKAITGKCSECGTKMFRFLPSDK